jgi:protein arginine kinase activator
MKCETCPKLATFHITEVLGEEHVAEVHLCESCAKRHLSTPSQPLAAPTAVPKSDDLADLSLKHCEACGIKFSEFRNTGRLGCPHDYDSFKNEIVPLLESIHAETKHAGKVPRRLPKTRADQHALADLRRQLQTAVTQEDYEAAASLRDKIKRFEDAAVN